MPRHAIALSSALSCVAGLLGTPAIGQDSVEAHMAAAKAAAGTEYAGVLERLCISPDKGPNTAPPGPPPERSTWLATPVKVFDNLYFVGTIEHSAWAVTTSAGIILVDTIYDYTTDAIVDGLKTLGLDPASIKYAIVSHGHGDHAVRRALSARPLWHARSYVRGRLEPRRDQRARAGEAQARHGG